MPSSASFSSRGEKAGLAIIATSGLLSALTTFSLLSYFVYCTFRTRSSGRGLSTPLTRGVNAFISTPLGRYLTFLILSDFFQGCAFVTNYYWASKGRMEESPQCTFQGALSQVGDLGAALWSLIIAFQTFALLFVQRKPPSSISWVVIAVIWTVLALLPIIGPTTIQTTSDGPFWGLSGAWCWVGVGYQISRLTYLYVWVFLNLACCFVIYMLIYLKFSGVVEYDPSVWHRTKWLAGQSKSSRPIANNRSSGWGLTMPYKEQEQHHRPHYNVSVQGYDEAVVTRHAAQVARRLMWYPIVYALVTIPVAICRLGVLSGWTPPFWLFVIAGTTFSASGLSNTILFLFTRHSFIQKTLKHAPICSTREVTVRVDEFPTTPLTPYSPGSPRFEKKPQDYHYLRTSRSDPFKVYLTTPTLESALLRPPSPSPRTPNTSIPFNYYSYQYRQPRSPHEAGPSPLALVASDATTAFR